MAAAPHRHDKMACVLLAGIRAMTMEFALAWLVHLFLQPDLAAMKTLELGWISQLWCRNMVLLILVAGGLHLWFTR